MTFQSFVILGAMRTGSNLLEESLNTVSGLHSHGELFNPHFIGGPRREAFGGFDVATRDADPKRLLDALQSADGMNGFRLFLDHDPRVIAAVLVDPTVAKIVLTRRPIDSYVSLQIAKATGQWWMGRMATAKTAKVAFDPVGYADYLDELTNFYSGIRTILQRSGQAAFHIDYSDLQDADCLTGLCRYLGLTGVPDQSAIKAKVQNPAPLSDLLTNPAEADQHLPQSFDLGAPRGHEPARGPGVRAFVGTKSGLLYMPIPGPVRDPIADGLTGETGMTRKDLRRWLRTHPGHQAVTVLRHPLIRAHDAFAAAIWSDDGPIPDVRDALRRHHGVDIPEQTLGDVVDLSRYKDAFRAFLTFLTGNLAGQSSLPVNRMWASQHHFVHAIGTLRPPDRLLREGDATPDHNELTELWDQSWAAPAPVDLADVATDEIRAIAVRAYRRDYLMFGFDP